MPVIKGNKLCSIMYYYIWTETVKLHDKYLTESAIHWHMTLCLQTHWQHYIRKRACLFKLYLVCYKIMVYVKTWIMPQFELISMKKWVTRETINWVREYEIEPWIHRWIPCYKHGWKFSLKNNNSIFHHDTIQNASRSPAVLLMHKICQYIELTRI